jgi:hypothetical protein
MLCDRYGVNAGPKNYRQSNAEYCAEHGLVLQGEQPLPEAYQTFESVGFPHDIMDEVSLFSRRPQGPHFAALYRVSCACSTILLCDASTSSDHAVNVLAWSVQQPCFGSGCPYMPCLARQIEDKCNLMPFPLGFSLSSV